MQRTKKSDLMTYRDRRYEKEIQEVHAIAAETALVDAMQTQVDFANKYVLRNFKVRLVMEDPKA